MQHVHVQFFHVSLALGSLQAQAGASYKPDGRRIAAAKKLAKSAASSLDFDDVATSVKLLTEALAVLTNPSHSVK